MCLVRSIYWGHRQAAVVYLVSVDALSVLFGLQASSSLILTANLSVPHCPDSYILGQPSDCPCVFHIAAAPCRVFLTLGSVGQSVWRWDVLRKHQVCCLSLCDVSSPFMLKSLWSLQTGGFRVLQCLHLQRWLLSLCIPKGEQFKMKHV